MSLRHMACISHNYAALGGLLGWGRLDRLVPREPALRALLRPLAPGGRPRTKEAL